MKNLIYSNAVINFINWRSETFLKNDIKRSKENSTKDQNDNFKCFKMNVRIKNLRKTSAPEFLFLHESPASSFVSAFIFLTSVYIGSSREQQSLALAPFDSEIR